MSEWWLYENLEPAPPEGYNWHPAGKGDHPDDNIDYHVDLGAGKLKKGRLTIDRHGDADILMDLNTLEVSKLRDTEIGPEIKMWHDRRLPFPDNSIESIISHHCLEHIGTGFLRLMDECYRVLKPEGKFRIIVPLFPSLAAVSDPDHVRYFTEETFESFCGTKNEFWSDVFAEPYTSARFKMIAKGVTPAKTLKQIIDEEAHGDIDEVPLITIDDLFKEPREIRVTLEK